MIDWKSKWIIITFGRKKKQQYKNRTPIAEKKGKAYLAGSSNSTRARHRDGEFGIISKAFFSTRFFLCTSLQSETIKGTITNIIRGHKNKK
jgi:hypothetical protein